MSSPLTSTTSWSAVLKRKEENVLKWSVLFSLSLTENSCIMGFLEPTASNGYLHFLSSHPWSHARACIHTSHAHAHMHGTLYAWVWEQLVQAHVQAFQRVTVTHVLPERHVDEPCRFPVWWKCQLGKTNATKAAWGNLLLLPEESMHLTHSVLQPAKRF